MGFTHSVLKKTFTLEKVKNLLLKEVKHVGGWCVYVYYMCVCPHAVSASYHADSVLHVLGEQQLKGGFKLVSMHATEKLKLDNAVHSGRVNTISTLC